jgi:predicted CoA-binding protein
MTVGREDDAETREMLTHARTIAVVGLSDKPERDSNEIARFLQAQGYRVIPVNPAIQDVLGERAYPTLRAIPSDVRIDIVDIFRRSDQVGPIVEEALERGVGAIWMQLTVSNPPAAELARARGIPVRQDLCIMQEHRRLGIPRGPYRATGASEA